MPRRGRGNYIRVGPKRVIKRAHSGFEDEYGTTVGSKALYTVEEDMTLIRTIGQYTLFPGTAALGEFVIGIARNGQQVVNDPDPTGDEEADVTDNELIRRMHPTHASLWQSYEFDIKGMRKLNKGDQIVIYSKSNTASVYFVYWNVDMFIKLA